MPWGCRSGSVASTVTEWEVPSSKLGGEAKQRRPRCEIQNVSLLTDQASVSESGSAPLQAATADVVFSATAGLVSPVSAV